MSTPNSEISSGKIIITGEHAVVMGYPAYAVPLHGLGIRATATQSNEAKHSPQDEYILKIFEEVFGVAVGPVMFHVESSLPSGAGLGSSAAYAKAIILALAEYLNISVSQEQLWTCVSKSEVFFHGNPSGVDAAVVVYDVPVIFQKKDGVAHIQQENVPPFPLDQCLFVHSGKASESTKEMVEMVARHPQRDTVFAQIGKLTENIIVSLRNGHPIWSLLTENERALEELGVVGGKAAAFIADIEAIGGCAKVCGAGGVREGSGIILVHHQDLSLCVQLAKKHGMIVLHQETKK